MSSPGCTRKYTDVKIDGITCEPWKNILLVKYYDDPLVIQSPWMNLSNYGIPRTDKLHTKEEDRQYVRVPLSRKQDDPFVVFIKLLDECFNSDDFRKSYLGDKQQKYEYFPLHKESTEDKYPPSMKLKMEIKGEGDQASLTTSFIRVDDSNKCERLSVYNMDDAMKAVSFRSDIRMLFRVMKVWVQPSIKAYGCVLRLKKIQIKKTSKEKEGEDDFIVSEEDNDDTGFVESATSPSTKPDTNEFDG